MIAETTSTEATTTIVTESNTLDAETTTVDAITTVATESDTVVAETTPTEATTTIVTESYTLVAATTTGEATTSAATMTAEVTNVVAAETATTTPRPATATTATSTNITTTAGINPVLGSYKTWANKRRSDCPPLRECPFDIKIVLMQIIRHTLNINLPEAVTSHSVRCIITDSVRLIDISFRARGMGR